MALKSRYESEGFVVVPGLVPPEDVVELQQACDRVIAITRSGGWKYRRTVGKQSPPWADEDPDSWGVQHVMHPDLGEPAFARWYTSDALLRTVQELLDCKEDELQMGKWRWWGSSVVVAESMLLKIWPIFSSIPFRGTLHWGGIGMPACLETRQPRKNKPLWMSGIFA
jgi:hypothetical protein